jgi:hypothetical protein
MAKHKRKAIAAATRGKATQHNPIPDNPDHDRSIVLAVKALSSSSFPPLASAVCSSVLKPIPEAAPGPASLDDVTVDDCSEDDALAGDLLDEEQLDFSFTDDDYEDLLPSPPLFPPPPRLVPTPLSGSCPPSTTVVAGSSPPSGGKVWTDLFSTNKPSTPCIKLQNFSLNHLTKTCAISPEDFQPQFEVWNGSVFHHLGPQIPSSGVSGHGQPFSVQGPFKDSSVAAIVEPEQAPCDDASDGWIVVEPRRKSKKHISNPPKRKEVFAVAAVSAMSQRSDVPSDCAGVVNSLGAGAVVDA